MARYEMFNVWAFCGFNSGGHGFDFQLSYNREDSELELIHKLVNP